MTIQEAREFKEAAIRDGWDVSPIYQTESVERAANLRRDGFHIMVFARPAGERSRKDYASVAIWGPDGMAIRVPETYSFDEIKKGQKICQNCGKEVDATFRFSFAGRCCAECLPAMQEKHEYPGWCN